MMGLGKKYFEQVRPCVVFFLPDAFMFKRSLRIVYASRYFLPSWLRSLICAFLEPTGQTVAGQVANKTSSWATQIAVGCC